MSCTKCDLCGNCGCKCECFDVDGENIEDLVLPKTYKLTMTHQRDNWKVKYHADIDILQFITILEDVFGIRGSFFEESAEIEEFVEEEEE